MMCVYCDDLYVQKQQRYLQLIFTVCQTFRAVSSGKNAHQQNGSSDSHRGQQERTL